jgi:hypothetical protein
MFKPGDNVLVQAIIDIPDRAIGKRIDLKVSGSLNIANKEIRIKLKRGNYSASKTVANRDRSVYAPSHEPSNAHRSRHPYCL